MNKIHTFFVLFAVVVFSGCVSTPRPLMTVQAGDVEMEEISFEGNIATYRIVPSEKWISSSDYGIGVLRCVLSAAYRHGYMHCVILKDWTKNEVSYLRVGFSKTGTENVDQLFGASVDPLRNVEWVDVKATCRRNAWALD